MNSSINNFIFNTKNTELIQKYLNLKSKTKTNIKNIPKFMLNTLINKIYWFRLGNASYSNYPIKPSDILGILFNGLYFYYKDGHPQWFGGTTHRQFIYLIANNLNELLSKMDSRDIQLFITNEQIWKPLHIKRCGCFKCREELQLSSMIYAGIISNDTQNTPLINKHFQ